MAHDLYLVLHVRTDHAVPGDHSPVTGKDFLHPDMDTRGSAGDWGKRDSSVKLKRHKKKGWRNV